MKKIFIGLLMIAVLAVAGCSKSGGFTPPIATPNQNLPLYESGATSGGDTTGDVQATPSDTGTAKALIKAEPDIIHKYGSSGGYDSKITVEDGSFGPNSTVTVWGETTGKDDVASPPWVYEADIDTEAEDIQLKVNENGGLEFWVRAGTSTGFFTINVGGSAATAGKASSFPVTAGGTSSYGFAADQFVNSKWDALSKRASFETTLSVTITITE